MAIAFENVLNSVTCNGSTSYNFSFITSAKSGLTIIAGIFSQNSGDLPPSGMSYNGVAMTYIGKLAINANVTIYVYAINNVTGGTYSLGMTTPYYNQTYYVQSVSYSGGGVAQSFLNSSGKNASANTIYQQSQSVSNNSWLVGFAGASAYAFSAYGAGVAQRTNADLKGFVDFGPKTPAGSATVGVTSSSQISGILAVEITAPLVLNNNRAFFKLMSR